MSHRPTFPPICSPMGDAALILTFGDQPSRQVSQVIHCTAKALSRANLPYIVDLVPTYTTLTVHYDPCQINSLDPYEQFRTELFQIIARIKPAQTETRPVIEIPVCYEADLAPDLDTVAKHCCLSPEEVIEIHSTPVYHVDFLGFAPGFPYLSGMDKRIETPRLETPRTKVSAGSVGIAGTQTGIYPLATPGGWQVIGHTPIKLVNFDQESPTILTPGDRIRFVPISQEEHQALEVNQ